MGSAGVMGLMSGNAASRNLIIARDCVSVTILSPDLNVSAGTCCILLMLVA